MVCVGGTDYRYQTTPFHLPLCTSHATRKHNLRDENDERGSKIAMIVRSSVDLILSISSSHDNVSTTLGQRLSPFVFFLHAHHRRCRPITPCATSLRPFCLFNINHFCCLLLSSALIHLYLSGVRCRGRCCRVYAVSRGPGLLSHVECSWPGTKVCTDYLFFQAPFLFLRVYVHLSSYRAKWCCSGCVSSLLFTVLPPAT